MNPFVDSWPIGAQRLFVLLRLDRVANPNQSSAQADSQVGGSVS